MANARILAVDDIPDNLLILETLLSDVKGYEFDCVENGKLALESVYNNPPDLLLLDVMMPDIDGFEVTRRIRQDTSLDYIPILLVTAHENPSLTEGLDAGADDFIRKPFDINELKARVRSLLRLKHSMDEQTEMLHQRDDFVARLTHDLRTPLVAANRVLELCVKGSFGDLPADVSDMLGNVVTNNNNLLQMTNTLLQVYRHEAGQKKLAIDTLCMRSLAEQVLTELKPLADDKGLSISLEAESPEDDSGNAANVFETEGDRIELRRVLTNLVGNAIKFTDKGSITLHLSVLPAPPDATTADQVIQISVTDTGIGIEPDMQKEIFSWYSQGNHMRAGNGLGLHLSQRIATLHNGTLAFESEPGNGSTFTLVLPKIDPSPAPSHKTVASRASQNAVKRLASV